MPKLGIVETANHLEKINAKRIDFLYENLQVSIPANLICATVILVGLHSFLNDFLLWSWYLAVLSISIFRLCSFYYFKKIRQEKYSWNIFYIGVFLSAASWGVVDSLLMPDIATEQMIVIVIVAGVTAGGLQSLQASLFACVSYIILIMLPLTIWLFFQHGRSYFILSFSFVTYLLFVIATAKRGYSLLTQILSLEFQNIELVNDLSSQNIDLDEAVKIAKDSKANLQSILENAPIGMAIVSSEGKLLQVNNALSKITNYSKEELENLSYFNIWLADDLTKIKQKMDLITQNKIQFFQLESQVVTREGRPVWVLMSASKVVNKLSHSMYIIQQYQDINERKQNEKELADLNNKTQQMLYELKQREYEVTAINKMNDMLQICQHSFEAYSTIGFTAQELFPNLGGGIIIYNKKNKLMESEKEWGKSKNLLSTFTVEDCWGLRAGYPYVVNDPSQEIICQHFNQTIDKPYICIPLMVQGGIIGMLYLYAMVNKPIDEHQQQLATTFSEVIKLTLSNIMLREKLREQAIQDPLTGLFNRRYLTEMLPLNIQKAITEKQNICVAMIDIDFFKKINDTEGHDAGDEVIKLVAKILKENNHKLEVAYRLGGEEFLLVLPNYTLQEAIDRLEKIRLMVKTTPVYFHDHPLPTITISVGIAIAPKQGTITSDLMRAADEALYEAKETGRDRICIHHETTEVK